MERFFLWLAALFIMVAGFAVGFGIFAGLVWLICWSFDLEFSWRYAFGVWLVWMLVSNLFKTKVTVEHENKRREDFERWRR